jgi:cytochrome c oxidase assembly factor CtaG
MNPTLSVLLLSWAWRPEIMATLALAATVHVLGRWRLKHRGGQQVVATWRSVSYLGGLAVLWVALMSPIDVLSGQYFFMHMIQHLLLVMLAPPLLLIGNPMPIMMWGFPAALRKEVGQWLSRGAVFRRVVTAMTTPGLVWFAFVAALVGWHDPGAYEATLRNDLVHDLEHLTFFGTAVLFWWHVIGAAPRFHKPLSAGLSIGYTLSVLPPNMITGVVISFTGDPLYPYYATVARPWQITVQQDQMLGGTIMWIPGSMMYLVAALILLARFVRAGEAEEPLTLGSKENDAALVPLPVDQQKGLTSLPKDPS